MVDWDRIADIVEEALALGDDHAARELIRERCGPDEALREACDASYAGAGAERDERARAKSSPDPLAGREFADFRLVERIGKGGMGVVYRAEQRGLGRLDDRASRFVAVKLLPKTEDADGRRLAERFRREVDHALGLVHPNIVRVLTSGETDEYLWFAMELVEGHDLHSELELQRRIRDGATGVATSWPAFGSREHVAGVVRQMADVAFALEHAHSLKRPLVHRDVKPRNILLREDGTPLLADFGLAKVLGEQGLTTATSRLGTLSYMSPEQARAASIDITTSSDIYSFGVVLFEALCLELPVPDTDYATAIRRISTGDIRRLDEINARIPRDLVTICHKCLSLKPGDRYATAGEVRVDLQRFLRHEAISARPPSLWKRLVHWVTKHPKTSVAAGVAVVVVVAALAASAWSARQARFDVVAETIDAALALPSWYDAIPVVAGALDAVPREDIPRELRHRLERLALRRRLELEAFKDEETSAVATRTVRTSRYGDVEIPPDESAFFERARRASAFRVLYPDDALLSLWSTASPELRVESDSGEADGLELVGRRVDLTTGLLGQPRDLGIIPYSGPIAPGVWRLVVDGVQGRTLELERELTFGSEVGIAVAGTPPLDSDHFARIPEATITLDEPRGIACCHVLDEVVVDEFYIARSTVSNREYIEFLDATGHRLPLLWRSCGAERWTDLPGLDDDTRREAFLDRPAVGMGQSDMQRYAEWRGCRLPTHFELEYALRGAEMTTAPGGPHNTGGPASDDRAAASQRFADYLAGTLPVDAEGYDAGNPFGLYHAWGNVHEATSTRPSIPVEGTLVTYRRHRVYLGGAWDAEADGFTIDDHGFREHAEQSAAAFLGFRLATSAAP